MSTTAAARSTERETTASSEAAQALFERYRPRVLAFCRSRTRNLSDAEDATQTTFMYALTGLSRGVVPEFELSWLLRIAENVCHSQRRRAHRRYERDELPVDLATTHVGDPALVTERRETITVALRELPESQRRALVLREWRGLSYHDIAAELQTSHAAVETLLFRARHSVAARVASFGPTVLQLLPAAGRLVRWALGSGAGKAAVVVASAATVGIGVSADGRLEPVERAPVTAYLEPVVRHATPRLPPAALPGRVAPPLHTPALRLPTQPEATAPVTPTEQSFAGAPVPRSEPTSAPAAAETQERSTPAATKEERPLVGVAAPLGEVEAVLDPVEEALAPTIEVVAEVEPALPSLPVQEELPEVEVPSVPKLPLP